MKRERIGTWLFIAIFAAVIVGYLLAFCGSVQPKGTGRFGDKVKLIKCPKNAT